ncbi:c-type cytochrome [Thiotrichales bacterium HSG1]|nr:c-type cytochrome [Thiotrichales bacterium HSG1]
MNIFILSLAIMLMIGFSDMALANNGIPKAGPDGAKLYVDKGCVACHGENANIPSQPQYPKLAGQNKEYTIAQIDDIKNGLRTNGYSIVMRGTIIVDHREIELIAEWLETLPIDLIEDEFKNTKGAELFKSKSCNTCHGDDTKSPSLPIYPKLAGQDKDYSFTQMKDIKSGKRNNGNSAAMQGVLSDVTEQEIKIIAEWLESLVENKSNLSPE